MSRRCSPGPGDSYAGDPNRFATATGQHDPAAQLAWFLTFERMLRDFEALGAAVDAPGVLRIQGGFDARDTAASLLAGPRGNDAAVFRRLLHRADALPRVLTAFEHLPMQLRLRFRNWAQLAFNRLYDDIADQTMPTRRTADGVLVGHNTPSVPPIYLQGIDNTEIIDTVRARCAPMVPVHRSLRL